MNGRPRRAGALLLAALAGLAIGLPSHGAAEGDAAAPVPIARILLSPERLGKELERVEQGALLSITRTEFEQKVQRAARAVAGKRGPPRLLEATYRASVQDGALSGTLEWKVINPGAGAAVWPLQPLNLALRQPRFEDADASIANFDGSSTGLLLDRGGRRSVAIAWSLRGENRPEGLYFAFEVPAAPVALLEVDLPPGQVATVLNEAVLVTGPHPTEQGRALQRWRIACGGRSQLNLLLRRTDGNRASLIVVKKQRTTQDVAPGMLDAGFVFDLAVLHQPARELQCVCDSSLRPYAVTLGNREVGWELRPAAAAAGPALLVIDPREPFWGGTLSVRCVAPLPMAVTGQAAWTSPALHVAQAVQRGEILTLRIHPDLQFQDWKPGGFRVTEAAAESERWQRLNLEGGGVQPEGAAPGSLPRRPSARLGTGGVAYRARQLAWWQLGAAQASLTLQITYDVQNGRLFQLPIRIPAGWEVERAEMNPPALRRNWTVRAPALPAVGASGTLAPAAGQGILLVDLYKPLTPTGTSPKADKPGEAGPRAGALARPAILTVYLHRLPSLPLLGRELTFPDVQPLGAQLCEGALAIGLDEQMVQARILTTSSEAEPEEEELWGNRTPDHYFPYSGAPVQGTVVLSPRPALLRARCTTDVFLASGRAGLETRLALEADAGTTDSVVIQLPFGSGPWSWRAEQEDNGIRRSERLPSWSQTGLVAVAAAGHPLRAAALLAARPPGERWRLTLARPLRVHEPVTLLGSRSLDRVGPPWDVPLPTLIGADRMEGEVILHLVGADVVQVESSGLTEASTIGSWGTRLATAWRIFRYGTEPAKLRLRGKFSEPNRPAEATADRVRLTTSVALDGLLRHHFTFAVTNWPQRRLPLPLPASARPVAARVDGHWLLPLPLGATEDGRPVLEFPVPARAAGESNIEPANVHHFEVIYTTTMSWSVFARVKAPVPTLPVAVPISFRRTWRLPPDVSPLFEGRQRRLPGPGEGYEPQAPGRWRSDLFGLSDALSQRRSQASSQRADLAEAVLAQSVARAGEAVALGEALEQVALHPAMQGWTLLVDAGALRDANITAETPAKIMSRSSAADYGPAWEALGLTVLHASPAAVLTTRRQAELWARAPGEAQPVSARVVAALAEAALHGQDGSGRFVEATAWARGEAGNRAGEASRLAPGYWDPETNWTAWEPRAGLRSDEEIILVRREVASLGGLTVAALLVLNMAWPRLAVGRRRLTYLLAWLAAAGLGLLWLPVAVEYLAWWPLVFGVVCGLAWYVRAEVRGGSIASGMPAAAAILVAPGIVVLLAASARSFQDTSRAAPFVVFLLPDAGNAPERQTVLAPVELMGRLEELAQAPDVPPAGAYLLSAAYEGKLAGSEAEFHAVFHVLSNADTAALALPLGGINFRLADGTVLVDGARVLATTDTATGTGFRVKVVGKGRHKVEASFLVRVTDATPERQIQFLAPRLVQNQLRFTVPGHVKLVRALARQGREHVDSTPAGTTLEASLGRISSPDGSSLVSLRWQEQAPATSPAVVQFREAYLWDLGVGSCSLSGLLQYTMSKGAVSSLAIDLPAELEVRDVAAQRMGMGPRVRLRDWRVEVAGPRRTLRLEFSGPVRDEVEVSLELVPATPVPAQWALPLPVPHGEAMPGGSFLAYRAHGLIVQRASQLRVTGIGAADFAPFWLSETRPDPRSLMYACTIRREAGAAPILRLHLQQAAPVLVADVDQQLRPSARRANLEAELVLSASSSDLALVECQVAAALPFSVTAVNGTDVRRWYQSGDRLVIWLARAVSATRVTVSGSCPLTPEGAGSRLELPRLRVLGAQKHTTTVHLEPAVDLDIRVEALTNLDPIAGAPSLDRSAVYRTNSSDYGGRFLVRPKGLGADAAILTFVEVRDRRLVFTANVNVRLAQGELRSLKVRLRNWAGEDVRLEAPQVAQQREQHRGSRDRSWTLTLQPNVKSTYRLGLTGSVPLDGASGLSMPDVTVSGVDRVTCWLAVNGPELQGEGAIGLQPGASPNHELDRAGGAAERWRHTGGPCWKVVDPSWRLRLVQRSRPTKTSPPRVFLAEQMAAVVDGRRWLHETVLWLQHEPNSDLTLRLPGNAEVLALGVDSMEVMPLQAQATRLWVPLPGPAGLRRVRLQWRFAHGVENFDAPNLETPLPEGLVEVPTVWTILTPPGWVGTSPGPGPRLATGPAKAALVHLERADVQLEISKVLAGQERTVSGAALAQAQRRFYSLLRLAEISLRHAIGQPETENDTATRPPAAWRDELLAQNLELARNHGFEEIRAEAERQGPGKGLEPPPNPAAAPEAAPPPPVSERQRRPGTFLSCRSAPGTPYRGSNRGATMKERVPRLHLSAAALPGDEAALGASVQWLGLLAVIWVLSLFPRALALARPLWPEQLALAAFAAWCLRAAVLLALGLVAFALVARAVYLLSWGSRLLHRWTAEPSLPTDGRAGPAPSSVRP